MTYVRGGVGRGADVGLLDHVRGVVRTHMDAEPAIEPGGIAAIETVDAVLRLLLHMLRIGHHESPASLREGRGIPA